MDMNMFYFVNRMYTINYFEINKPIITDEKGFIYSKEELELLKQALENSEKLTNDFIESHNAERYNKFHNTKVKPIKEKLKKEGYVYVIKKNDENIVKIGMSKNYDERTKQITTKLYFEVETIKVFKTDDMESLEKHLHELYKDKRLNGEWFKLTDSDIKHIKKMELD